MLSSHSLCSITLNHVQGNGEHTTAHIPGRDCCSVASLSPQIPADQVDPSKASLAPTKQRQLMLIRECRTLGSSGCRFGSEVIPCFLNKVLALATVKNDKAQTKSSWQEDLNMWQASKGKKQSHHFSHTIREQEQKDTLTQKSKSLQESKLKRPARVWEVQQHGGANKHCLILHEG